MTRIRVKNWHKFQHFKDRRPPWIKLYRDILDDREWHALEPAAAKALVMFWLIASEDDGVLPSVADLAFRLRVSETQIQTYCSALSHWLEQDDIAAIPQRHRSDAPETETETETETEREEIPSPTPSGSSTKYPPDFEKVWAVFPKREGDNPKKQAFAAWKARLKAGRTVEEMQAGAERYARFCREKGKVGTEFVMQARTFFGPADRFLEPWSVGAGQAGKSFDPFAGCAP